MQLGRQRKKPELVQKYQRVDRLATQPSKMRRTVTLDDRFERGAREESNNTQHITAQKHTSA